MIVYHTYSDPWTRLPGGFHANRFTHYGVRGIPSVRLDGVLGDNLFRETDLTGPLSTRLAIDSPVKIEMDAVFGEGQIDVGVDLTADENGLGGSTFQLYVCAIDKMTHFNGANGVTEWEHGLLTMKPDVLGTMIFVLGPNATEHFDYTFEWPIVLGDDPVPDDNVKFVAYLKDGVTKEILNSEWVEPHAPVAVDEGEAALPSGYTLQQNFPNPFNPSTEITFSVPEKSDVSLTVFDISGRIVAKLANNSYARGVHTVEWDASEMASGVYFYRISAKGNNGVFQKSCKMILMK